MIKLGWLFIAVFTFYILLVFKAPILSTEIDKLIWIEWFSEKVVIFKWSYDKVVTRIPTKEELEAVYSWAIETVDQVKGTIDEIREKAWEVEDTYNQATDFINEAWEKLDQAKETFDDVKDSIEGIKNIIWTWAIETSTWELDKWETSSWEASTWELN